MPITEALYAEYYAKHYKGTHRFLLAKGVSQELAEDTCQAAWVRAWEKREQWQGTSSFHVWVNTIAWNYYLGEVRKRPVEQFPEHFDSPVAPVDRHAEMDAERALAICSPNDRQLLAARYLQELSFDDAAALFALKPNTFKTRIFRIAKLLRAKLTALPRKHKRRSPQWRKRGVRHVVECEWCGITFEYRSTLLPNGKPRYPRRCCSRSCIPAMAHEGRRKMPMSEKRLRDLYEVKKLNTTQIAKMFGCATHKTVCRALQKFNITMRPRHHIADGKCKECGAPVVRRPNGTVLMRLCRKHQTAYQTEWARKRRELKNLGLECRPLGRKRKPLPCPRCGVECIGTREALAHCPSEVRQERARRGWITRKQRAT